MDSYLCSLVSLDSHHAIEMCVAKLPIASGQERERYALSFRIIPYFRSLFLSGRINSNLFLVLQLTKLELLLQVLLGCSQFTASAESFKTLTGKNMLYQYY